MGPLYCKDVCDANERCFAESEEQCLKREVEVIENNAFAWEVFGLCITQFEYSDFSGRPLRLRYEPVIALLAQGGCEGDLLFEELEKIQTLEVEFLELRNKAAKIAEEREKQTKEFERINAAKS